MPQKPKKKKPQRGVMTTSIPSKAQIAAATIEAEDPQTETTQAQPTKEDGPGLSIAQGGGVLQSNQADREEELLQLLVEKCGPKVQRRVDELISERRVLRTTGLLHPVYIEALLGLNDGQTDLKVKGLADRVFDLVRREAAAAWMGRDMKIHVDGSDGLVAQVWMIFRTLVMLGFPEANVKRAIVEVIGFGRVGLVSGDYDKLPNSDAAGEDMNMQLFEEVLDWLAMDGSLPRYDGVVSKGKGNERAIEPAQLKSGTMALDKSRVATQLPSLPQSQKSSRPKPAKAEPSLNLPIERLNFKEDGKARDAANSLFEDNDDGGDILPEELLPTWLLLKKQLLALDPTLALSGNQKQKSPDPILLKLKERIKKIERDPFFDTREAGEKWSLEVVKLKDTGALQATLSQQGRGRRGRKGNWWAEKDTSLEEGQKDQEPVIDIIPVENNIFEEAKLGGEQADETVTLSSVIHVRDFEQPQGNGGSKFNKIPKIKLQANVTSARLVKEVVEEVLRLKDANAKLTYTSLTDRTYSARYSLSIRWSKPELLLTFLSSCALPSRTPTPYPLPSTPDVTMSISRETVTFTMAHLSAATVLQSQAYISTVVLYQLFGGSTCGGGNGYVRISGVWRDLWAEFVENDRVGVDDARVESERVDKEKLMELKNLVFGEDYGKAAEAGYASGGNKIELQSIGEIGEDLSKGDRAEHIIDWERRAWGETLKQEWGRKANSEAYIGMLGYRRQLPMWSFKQQVLDILEKEAVVIICGETGCGKSTQVPAFILENELSNGRHCKVFCTEPRRISAITLARRVSQELGEKRSDLGGRNSLVGYAIRLESCMGSWTRLVYATTGIVMRMLETSPDLDDVTHLILDEVHERSIDSDFLLIVLKQLLVRRRNLKIVLMSATVDAERFSRYLNHAPIINVPGRTFPVVTQYLEDAVELTNFSIDENVVRSRKFRYGDEWDDEDTVDPSYTSTNTLPGYSKETRTTLSRINESQIQYNLIVKLIETIATHPEYVQYSKAILVFLPGIGEIRKLNDFLMGHHYFSNYGADGGWLIYPLHSSIASEEQEAAFLVPPRGSRKIILATNIAETGITIPDITCVIDSGRHKEMWFNERRQLSRLVEHFISKANAKQRRGRAGRVQEGLCFHLFTKERFDSWMSDQQIPEMMRLSLQDLALRVKICKLGAIMETLTMALDPPLPRNIRRAVDSLIQVKALTISEELTPLGLQLSKLPLDVYLGKLVLFGWFYGCLDAATTIAAILSSKSPFAAPMGLRKEADAARLAFKKGDSDLQTIYSAYCSWRRVCQGTNISETEFCRRNYLSSRTLSAIEDLKGQLITCVVDAGFLSLTQTERQSLTLSRFQFPRKHFFSLPTSVDTFSDNENVVNSIIGASFFPKLLTRDLSGWRNMAKNQHVNINLRSVNKGNTVSKWLSYYQIIQNTNVGLNDAHETSNVDDIAIALLCGDISFRSYAGVAIVDGHRIKLCYQEWKSLLAMKILRKRLMLLASKAFNQELLIGGLGDKESNEMATEWMDIARELLSVKRMR